jgi:hypothetical protein
LDKEKAIADNTPKAKAAIKQLGGNLKKELLAAMKQGDPMQAMDVCKTKAMPITAEAQKSSGIAVGRTSEKYRNPENKPDAWETATLQQFATRMGKGEDAKGIDHAEVVTMEGKPVFRYMKALPVAPPCLACHGSNIAPEVQAKIKTLYPEDKATGFNAGALRGAFTVQVPL